MAIWAEIKRALNSTLGTSGFKSLDNIINDARDNIKEVVNTTTDWASKAYTEALAAKNNTATNNTDSTTGTLSQKLTHIINSIYSFRCAVKPSITGTGATVYSSSEQITAGYNDEDYICIAKFIAPVDGLYKIKATVKSTTELQSITLYKIASGIYTYSTNNSNSSSYDYAYATSITASERYANTSIGATSRPVSGKYWSDNFSEWGSYYITLTNKLGSFDTSKTENVTCSIDMYCEAGEPVIIIARGDTSYRVYFTSVTITYQEG